MGFFSGSEPPTSVLLFSPNGAHIAFFPIQKENKCMKFHFNCCDPTPTWITKKGTENRP